MSVTKTELDELARGGCSDPECNHAHNNPLFIHSSCHPQEKTIALSYQDGLLTVWCAICKAKVAEVVVAAP